MAHLATKRYGYQTQLGILTALCGGGLIAGGLLSYIPLLSKINLSDLQGDRAADFMKTLMVPENATVIRWMQFISTLFLFFLPPVIYSKICHQYAFKHLGFRPRVNIRSVLLALAIMFCAMPLVDGLQRLTEMLPWSANTRLMFAKAEDDFNRQIAAIARMNGLQDYIVSLLMIAILPAMFEEVLFRGGLQNLLSRWLKKPVWAVVITAALFSAVHFSYLGFLSRFTLGFLLGWFYYRTGNIWINIICHAINNAIPVTYLYIKSKAGVKVDPSQIGTQAPLWLALVSVCLVMWLMTVFDKASKDEIDRPGEEVMMPGYIDSSHPFTTNSN